MVLIPLLRVSAKAAILGGTVWLTHHHGVWGDSKQGHEVATKVQNVGKVILRETGTPVESFSDVTRKMLPDGANTSDMLDKVPEMPSYEAVQKQAKYSWNSVVDSSVYVLQNAPQLLWSSMKTVARWVHSANVREDKQ